MQACRPAFSGRCSFNLLSLARFQMSPFAWEHGSFNMSEFFYDGWLHPCNTWIVCCVHSRQSCINWAERQRHAYDWRGRNIATYNKTTMNTNSLTAVYQRLCTLIITRNCPFPFGTYNHIGLSVSFVSPFLSFVCYPFFVLISEFEVSLVFDCTLYRLASIMPLCNTQLPHTFHWEQAPAPGWHSCTSINGNPCIKAVIGDARTCCFPCYILSSACCNTTTCCPSWKFQSMLTRRVVDQQHKVIL